MDKRDLLRAEDPADVYDIMVDTLKDYEIDLIANAIINEQRVTADELWRQWTALRDDIDIRIDAVRSGCSGKTAKLRAIRHIDDKARTALLFAIDAEMRYDTLVERYGGFNNEEEEHG